MIEYRECLNRVSEVEERAEILASSSGSDLGGVFCLMNVGMVANGRVVLWFKPFVPTNPPNEFIWPK